MKTTRIRAIPRATRPLIAAALLALGSSASYAQAVMDHSRMDHGGPQPAASTDGTKKDDKPMDHGSMDHGSMDHGSMDHGSMDMSGTQGGTPAPDARDPNAYSGGYTLTTGPHRYDGAQPLHTADTQNFASLLVDRLERVDARNSAFTAWDVQAAFGRDFEKLVFRTEGEYVRGEVEFARNELLWSHAIAGFWDLQAGWRHDIGEAPEQDWLAVGIQGLAPYWFELGVTAYLGKGGQSALRLDGEYDLLLTQRLVLQPRVEFNAYGRRDDARAIGAGPADLTAGFRLRYELSRQFAPYLGIEWTRLFGTTADLAREEGAATLDTRLLAGVRVWF